MSNDVDEELEKIFENNKAWAQRIQREQPHLFERLSHQQHPDFLWIGCSDSRVPANNIISMPPGELFVHRNIANLVVPGDLSCMSVLQYAVDVLGVKHIVVCGHYGCGGVKAAMSNESHGLIDSWLYPIRDLYHQHRQTLDPETDDEARVNRLCELNVIEQVANISRTPVVQKAWGRGQHLKVHGVIYSIKDGILHDLNARVSGVEQTPPSFHVKSGEIQ